MSCNRAILAVFVLTGLILALAPIPARAQETLQLVTLPETSLWCVQAAVPEATAETEDAVIDAAKEAASDQIDTALLAANIPYSGLPFVLSAKLDPVPLAPGPQAPPVPSLERKFRIEVCAAVSIATPAPQAPVVGHKLASASYGVLPCGALEEEDCVAALRKAMFNKFGAERTEIYESPILMTQVATGLDPAAIAIAFQSGTDRATYRALAVDSNGASVVPLEREVERPMLLDSQAATIVTGIPVATGLIAALRAPTP